MKRKEKFIKGNPWAMGSPPNLMGLTEKKAADNKKEKKIDSLKGVDSLQGLWCWVWGLGVWAVKQSVAGWVLSLKENTHTLVFWLSQPLHHTDPNNP